MEPQPCKIAIVGGGPAGLAAALHIVRQAPHLKNDLLVLEAEQYPRTKLCGGGVTVHGEEQLRQLGLRIDVPAFHVQRVSFLLGSRSFTVPCRNAMRIIQREEFDAALAQAVTAQGIHLHAQERLLDVEPLPAGVMLTTNRAQYRAEVVVGADGANSTVRRKMRLHHPATVARLLRVLAPVNPDASHGWRQKTAVFDFSCVMNGIQGYIWDFPCYVAGQPAMNRGIFDSRIAPHTTPVKENLKQIFSASLRTKNIDLAAVPLEGHPVRWFDPTAIFSFPRVLLAGDAAGVDPLFAEGISYAMEYGKIVAQVIQEAYQTGDFSFNQYRQRLLDSHLGHLLQRRTFVAKNLYLYRRPPLWSLLWGLANIAPARLQRLVGASLALLPP